MMDCEKLSDITDVFKFMKMKTKIIIENYHKVVLVLGNTGSGKSTLVQFLTGNDTSLRSVETGIDTCEFIIQDDNGRIGHTIDSKTIFPEGFIDAESNIVYYDCQGFGDTRNAALDIASNVLRHEIIDYSKYIKIVLTVNYSSVSVGVDRTDFVNVIKYATEFINNIDLSDNIAIVITKVENKFMKGYLVPDSTVINAIVNYMKNVKKSLQQRLEITTDTDEQIFYQRAIHLIQIFITEQNGTFPKIAVFRRPDCEGLIHQIPLLQVRKETIISVIKNNIHFKEVKENIFGSTISDSSKIRYLKFIDKITNPLESKIISLTSDVMSIQREAESEKARLEYTLNTPMIIFTFLPSAGIMPLVVLGLINEQERIIQEAKLIGNYSKLLMSKLKGLLDGLKDYKKLLSTKYHNTICQTIKEMLSTVGEMKNNHDFFLASDRRRVLAHTIDKVKEEIVSLQNKLGG